MADLTGGVQRSSGSPFTLPTPKHKEKDGNDAVKQPDNLALSILRGDDWHEIEDPNLKREAEGRVNQAAANQGDLLRVGNDWNKFMGG